MTTETELPPVETYIIPNLGGILTTGDLYKKGKFDYSAWAKTAQRIRENAPNWYFALEPNKDGDFVWKQPDNSGLLMGYFQNVVTGIKLPLFPYAITNNFNKPIEYEKISANDVQNSHRRCLCACGCYSFGDAFELWARVEVKELDQEQQALISYDRDALNFPHERLTKFALINVNEDNHLVNIIEKPPIEEVDNFRDKLNKINSYLNI